VLTPRGLTDILENYAQIVEDRIPKTGSKKRKQVFPRYHQLVGAQQDDRPVFDSVIVVTDRRILEQQIRNTIKQFAQVRATAGAVSESAVESKTNQLRRFLESGKRSSSARCRPSGSCSM
jgi:type I restriction enzyme, R subunit